MQSKISFLLLNILGGIAVLGSYAWGILTFPDLREAFWGGVPESLRGLYTINMFLAAVGYLFVFSYFMLYESAENIARLTLPYFLILIPSALWLPLTVAVLFDPSKWLWTMLRADLFAVALGGLMLYPAVLRIDQASTPVKSFACIGLAFFCLQTVVLDALIWPYYFELPSQ